VSAFVNLSFESVDPVAIVPGNALGWAWTRQTALHIAPFGDLFQRADGFEHGWNADDFFGTLADTTTEIAVYVAAPVPQRFDGFETGWQNDAFQYTLASATAAAYPTGLPLPHPPTETFDSFERVGWSVVPFYFVLADAPITSGTTDGFEGWVSPFLDTFSPGDLTAADFVEGGSTGTVESFESFVIDRAIAATPPNTITVVAHGFVNGDRVKFFAAIDTISVLPAGISDQITYFVKNATTDTFEISVASGGSSVVMADAGNGTSYVRTNVTTHWGGRDGDTSGSDP